MVIAFFSILLLFCPDGFCTDITGVEIEKIAVGLVRNVEHGGCGIVRTNDLKQWTDQKNPVLIVFTGPENAYKMGHYPGTVQFELPIPELKEMDEAQKAAFTKAVGTRQKPGTGLLLRLYQMHMFSQ